MKLSNFSVIFFQILSLFIMEVDRLPRGRHSAAVLIFSYLLQLL